MWKRLRDLGVWLGPAFALGLYSGRIVSEQWAMRLPFNWGVALLLTAVLTAFALFITHNHSLPETWPLLLLYVYLFYPEPRPAVWVMVGLVTAVCVGQVASGKWQVASEQEGRDRRETLTLSETRLFPPVSPVQQVSWWLGFGVVLAFGVVYWLTVSPGVLAADSGELQLVAANLGVAHPPGFPLYTMLGHLMTWLPVGETAAFRLNLLAIITSTATLLLVYVTVFDLTRRPLAGVTAAIALGTATTFWAQATTANIRSLTGLFAALALWGLMRFYQETKRNWQIGERRWGDWWLVVVALALSLGVTHHLSLLFMGIVFIGFVVLVDPSFVKMPGRWVRPLLAALIGLLPLLYLPLRANADVRGASESLATLDGLLRHFLGLGFQGDFFYFSEPLVLGLRLGVMRNVLTFQFSPWLLAGMVIGFVLMAWREWKLALLMGLSFALHSLITAMYRAPQTVEYMLPAYIPMVLCLGYGVGSGGAGGRRSGGVEVLGQVFTAVMFTAALFQGWQHWPSYRQLHFVEDAREYAQNLLADAPPDSLILANWHWVTPLWYLQEVEGQRPDVTVQYIAPGKGPYGETWAREIAAALADGRNVIATWYDTAAYANLPPPEPIHEAFWFRQQPRPAVPEHFTPLNETLGENIQLLGYQLDKPQTEIWQETMLTLAWQPISQYPHTPISLNTHLISPDGRSYAQSDQTITPQPEGITLTQFRLTPRPGTPPGDYAIHIGSGEASTPISTLTVTPMSQPPVTQHPVYRTAVAENRRLIGYDWDDTLPGLRRLYLHWQMADGYVTEVVDGETAVPMLSGPWGVVSKQWAVNSEQWQNYIPLGSGLVWVGTLISNLQSPISPENSYDLPQQFTTNHPILRDYVVSTRLVGYEADGFHWAWCDLVDYVPAMAAIPTLKWIGGSTVTSPHLINYPDEPPTFEAHCQSIKPVPGAPVLAVDGAATPGQTVGGMVTVYDAFTQRPLPILDERISNQFPWIPLGETILGD
jgi:hypothetical protein